MDAVTHQPEGAREPLLALRGITHATQLRLFPDVAKGSFSNAWGPTIGYIAVAALLAGMIYYTRSEAAPAMERLVFRY
ncbi:MAG: hypothetical protein HY260_12085 [Chloroflexi bacterium]|nr:hypothetical protein [Chloroflexota bacterium]